MLRTSRIGKESADNVEGTSIASVVVLHFISRHREKRGRNAKKFVSRVFDEVLFFDMRKKCFKEL